MWECSEGQTDTQTAVANIYFASTMPHATCNYLIQTNSAYSSNNACHHALCCWKYTWCWVIGYGSAECISVIFISWICLPSVLWHCWLGVRKRIWPVKNWVIRWWHGYLAGVRCKWFEYGPADATAICCFIKIQLVWPFWCWLTQVVLEKRPLNGVCLSLFHKLDMTYAHSS